MRPGADVLRFRFAAPAFPRLRLLPEKLLFSAGFIMALNLIGFEFGNL